MKNGIESIKRAACRLVLAGLATGCIVLVMLGLVAGNVEPAAAAGGATVSVVGASTGTNVAVVSSVAATYYGIKVATGTPGGFFKVFNSSNGVGIVLSSEANLLDVVAVSSSGAVGQPANNFQNPDNTWNLGKNASIGISVIKVTAGDVGLVHFAP